MVASHPPIPFDPQGLVALEFLSIAVTTLAALLPLAPVAIALASPAAAALRAGAALETQAVWSGPSHDRFGGEAAEFELRDRPGLQGEPDYDQLWPREHAHTLLNPEGNREDYEFGLTPIPFR